MTSPYATFVDDWFVNTQLTTRLPLPVGEPATQDFLQRIHKMIPTMNLLREEGESGVFLGEKVPEEKVYRWMTVEENLVQAVYFNPVGRAEVASFVRLVLENIPPYLSVTPIDQAGLEIIFGFCIDFQGNQDQLVAETWLADSPLLHVLQKAGSKVYGFTPRLCMALNPDCTRLAAIHFKSRTMGHEVATDEYDATARSTVVDLASARATARALPDIRRTVRSGRRILGELFCASRSPADP